MPGSLTTPGRLGARNSAPDRIAFRTTQRRRRPELFSVAAQWLACVLRCTLTGEGARFGADVGRYSFIAVDSHHLLLADLPAHPCENPSHDMIHWGCGGIG